MVDAEREWERGAFLKEVQRVCAEELARCIETIGGLSTQKHQENGWRREMEQAMETLRAEIVAAREETRGVLQGVQDDRNLELEGILQRLRSLESQCTPVSDQTDAKEDTATAEMSETRVPELATGYLQCVCGDPQELSGVRGLNVAAYVLQYARVHRGNADLLDEMTGDLVKYPVLLELVEALAAALDVRGFHSGDSLRVSHEASGFRALVVILGVWALKGVVEIGYRPCFAEELGTGGGARSDKAVWRLFSLQPPQDDELSLGRTITTEDPAKVPTGTICYTELVATKTSRRVLFAGASPDETALKISTDTGKECVTHLQLIASIERSITVFTMRVLTGKRCAVWNTLGVSHPAGLTLGVLPAIVMGHSIIQAPLSTRTLSQRDIVTNMQTQEAIIMTVSPASLAKMYEVRQIRALITFSLEAVVCVGIPTPTLSRTLRWLAAWKPNLLCWRVLSSASIGGAVMATHELLDPIRQNQQHAAYPLLGNPLPGIRISLEKSSARFDLHSLHDGDTYHVSVGASSSKGSTHDKSMRILGEICAGNDDSMGLNLSVVGIAARRLTGRVENYSILPIEAIVATHPLVADTAFPVQVDGEAEEIMHDQFETVAGKGITTHKVSSRGRVLYVCLTTSAHEFEADSTGILQKFLEKKLLDEGDRRHTKHIRLVSSIPRDEDGHVLLDELEDVAWSN